MSMTASDVRPLRFLHIPKTAGTSINVFLDRFYPPEQIFVFKHDDTLEESLLRLKSYAPERRRGIRLYRGHAPLVTGDAEVDGARTFTLLREPVSRVVSFCNFVAEVKLTRIAEAFRGGQFDLDALLDSGHREMENLQTRMLVGEETYASLRENSDTGALRKAVLETFDRLDLVGLQERYEDTVLAATLIYGWRPTSPRKTLNARRSARGLHFSESTMKRIRELNRMDVLTYRFAVERFEATYRKRAAGVAALKFRLRVRGWKDRVLSRLPRLPPPGHVAENTP